MWTELGDYSNSIVQLPAETGRRQDVQERVDSTQKIHDALLEDMASLQEQLERGKRRCLPFDQRSCHYLHVLFIVSSC